MGPTDVLERSTARCGVPIARGVPDRTTNRLGDCWDAAFPGFPIAFVDPDLVAVGARLNQSQPSRQSVTISTRMIDTSETRKRKHDGMLDSQIERPTIVKPAVIACAHHLTSSLVRMTVTARHCFLSAAAA